ncbi:MAG: ROK family protein [Fimbriimonadaceae bacterium]
MTVSKLLAELRKCPLVASVQPEGWQPGLGVNGVVELARASVKEGVRCLRIEGAAVGPCRSLGVPVMGLVKQNYEASEIYITPTSKEVEFLLDAGCEAIALDATRRPRPGGESLEGLVRRIKEGGRIAIGDCDSVESALAAQGAGCDLVSNALAGYTTARPATSGPDWELLDHMVGTCTVPVLLEGRVRGPHDFVRSMRAGAAAAVVGSSLNDAHRLTRSFVRSLPGQHQVGAVDIGGTWMRFAVFEGPGSPGPVERAPLPPTFAERLAWIQTRSEAAGVEAVGVSSGGTIHPESGLVVESLDTIPDNVGRRYALDGIEVRALNDGLASAWAHGHLGNRVLTVAVGTGLGAGLVTDGRLDIGPNGEYLRLNEAHAPGGGTFEEALCSSRAEPARLGDLSDVCQGLFRPDKVFLCGSRGLDAEYLKQWPRAIASPFGQDAGLHGAAALFLSPPPGVFD